MINIANRTVSNYAPFRTYKRYKHQDYVEKALIGHLKNGNIDDVENEVRVYIPTSFNKKQVFLDFVIEKSGKIGIIEVDGNQHYEFTPKFHKNYSDFVKQQNRDKLVDKYCKTQGKLLRIRTTLTQEQADQAIDNFIKSL